MAIAQDSIGFWVKELDAARQREKDWRKEGERILAIYGGEKKDEMPFNILYSNTETLLPSLYSATPRPVVRRRFRDDDPLGKSAAEAGKRGLEFLLDTDLDGYETFDESAQSAVLDALLPGRGVTAIKYDAEVKGPDGSQYKATEIACTETWKWDRVLFGYCTKWSRCPWVAYEMYVDREEANELFGNANAAKLTYTKAADDKPEDGRKSDEDQKGEVMMARVYQVWDKDGGRKIRYVSTEYKDGFLRVLEDPLGLTGFFNCPRPIQLVEKSNDREPVAPYALYEQQAKELNSLTVRITWIVKAIKAKALYDSSLGDDVKKLLEADELDLVPADQSESIANEKGLQNSIWFWPVEKLIMVLRELYAARESCKQVIFEIMGLADIMRGSSQASETLGAQQIKTQWGSLRLRRPQKEVQRYCVDILRLMLEVAATKFSEDTWARMTGLPFLTQRQAQQAQMIYAAAQQAAAMPGPDGQPSPQAQQQLQQAQAELSKPRWEDVLALLKDDVQRAYKIDIETNSTLEPEAVEDQKNIADVMNALGQFLNGISPLVEKGVMPFQAAQSMMLAIVRRFRFGDEIEDYVKQMKAPTPPDTAGAEAAKAQMEAASKDKDRQQKAADAQADRQAKEADAQRQQQAQQAQIMGQVEMERIRQQAETEREAMRLEGERRRQQAELANEYRIEEMKARFAAMTAVKTASDKQEAQASERGGPGAVKEARALLDDAEGAFGEAEATGRQTMDAVAQILTAITESNERLVKEMTRPRKRVAKRGANGRIDYTEEVMQ